MSFASFFDIRIFGKSDDFEVDKGHGEAPAAVAVPETILTIFSFVLFIGNAKATFLFLLSGGVGIRGHVLLGGLIFLLSLLFSSIDVSEAKNNKDQ